MPADLSPEALMALISARPLMLLVVALLVEDLACLVAGVLITGANLPVHIALITCGLGTLLGDLVLFCVARLAGPALMTWAPMRGRLSEPFLAHLRSQSSARVGRLVLSARVLPGLRVPVFMGLGALKLPSRRFVPWACLAATLWTLGMVALGAALGEASFAISEASPYVAAMVLGAVALVTIRALTRPRPDAPSDA